jgi:hypothetical protein
MKGLLFLCILFVMGCQVKKGETNNIFEDHVPQPNVFTASSALNTTYDVGQTIHFTMSFPYPVTVTGSPTLKFLVGSTTKSATYVSGSGATILNFDYTVLPGDNDLDGISLQSLELNGGALTYNQTVNCNLSFMLPNFSTILVDTAAPTITSITSPTTGFYILDQNMVFTVNFSEKVNSTGTPRLSLNIGGSTKFAAYVSGSGTTALQFRYTVTDTDSDQDGIVINSPLQLNSGSIMDPASHAASLTFSSPNTSGVIVAGVNPIVRSITPPVNATYLINNQINYTLTFNKAVTVSGTPQLTLNIGGASKLARYVSGSGTSSLVFRYTVIGGDLDTDGVTLSSPISLSAGTINSSAGAHPAILTFANPVTPGVLVFTSLPTLTRVDLPPSPPANGYILGASFNLTAVFAEPMTVTGPASRIKFDLGGITKYATYVSGSGTENLVYRYTVVNTDQDLDGISLASPLELAGGTMVNGNGSTPILTFTPPTGVVKVDALAPTILSNTVPPDSIYTATKNLDFVVTFSEPVLVTGQPRLVIQVGSTVQNANYLSGSGTSTITFRYTVSNVDFDDNGITLINSIDLNGGTINDPVAHPSSLTIPNTNTSGVIVDATSARIEALTAPSNKTYKIGEVLNFFVRWTKPVDVVGTPRIAITLDSGTVYATYALGSGSQDLIFRYTVLANDVDSNGVALVSPIQLNGGTIRDSANFNGLLAYDLPITTGILIDGINLAPTLMTPPADANYRINDILEFTVTFNYPAYITGTPRLTLAVGSSTRYATYVSGSATTGLLFRYTVAEGESDADGISVTNGIDLNGGTLKDFFGDNATALTFTVSAYPNKRVDGVRPTISSAAVSANKTYRVNEPISFTLTYSEIVNVTGNPRIALVVGSTTRYATYLSGSGSTQLVFQYLPQNGDTDLDGISAAALVSLNGASIKDTAGNDQTDFSYSVPNLALVKVDATAPTVNLITATATGTFHPGQTLNFSVTFSENVSIDGTPTLALNLRGATKSATYVSGSGSNILLYSYTVVLGDEDIDGVDVDSVTGTIKDAVGNEADYNYSGNKHFSDVLVDGIRPTITSTVLPASTLIYLNTQGSVFSIKVNFSENVIVSTAGGTPYLILNFGNNANTQRQAVYSSGTGTTQLSFNYTVANTDIDFDGITFGNSNNITLSGGTIKDEHTNASFLGLGAAPASGPVVVSSSLLNWYDPSHSPSVVPGGLVVSSLKDKYAGRTLSASGTMNYRSNFNGGSSNYIECSSGGSLNGSDIDFRAVASVYKTPISASGSLFNSDTPFLSFPTKIEFNNPNGARSASTGGQAGFHRNGNWSGNGFSLQAFWDADTISASLVRWDQNNTRSPSICKMAGQLAEMLIYKSVPSDEEILTLKTYFTNKHNVTIP